MYHTMYPPPMLVQVGQQGHFEGRNRMPTGATLPPNPFDQNVSD